MRCYRSVVAALNRKSAVWSFANTFMKAFMIQPDIPMQLFSHEGASQPCFLHLYVSLIILGDSNSKVEKYMQLVKAERALLTQELKHAETAKDKH